jgi:hypothetical protein
MSAGTSPPATTFTCEAMAALTWTAVQQYNVVNGSQLPLNAYTPP